MSNANFDTAPATLDPETGEIRAAPAAIVAPTWADEYCALSDHMEAVRLEIAEREAAHTELARERMASDEWLAGARELHAQLATKRAAFNAQIEAMLADAPEGFSIDSGRFRVRKPKRRETWRLGKTAKELGRGASRHELIDIVRGMFPDADYERVVTTAEALIAWLDPQRKLGAQGAAVVTVRPPEAR